MKKDDVRVLINGLLAVAVFAVWILSFFFWRDSALGGSGWSDLKYFTVESNLFVGVVAVLWVVLRLVKGKMPKWMTYLKYLSAASVLVTFAVVVIFLGPLYGYGRMYYGANLFFHLLIPLAAMGEWIFFEKERISFRESFLAMIPPFVYGVGYLVNCVVNGVGSWETTRNDWYSFLEWGYLVGIAIFVVICLIAWGAGLCLRAVNKVAQKSKGENRV